MLDGLESHTAPYHSDRRNRRDDGLQTVTQISHVDASHNLPRKSLSIFRPRVAGPWFALLTVPALLCAQEQPTVAPPQPPPHTDEKPTNNPPQPEDKRIFGVLPNARTAGFMAVYKPITTRQKFKIAEQDSFGWNILLLSGAFAGLAQVERTNPSFGEGVEGYAHYYWTAYIDQGIGNFMSEAIFPSMLHEDPRYFLKGEGSTKSRIGSAIRQIFWTRKDNGGHQINFSELGGNAVATAISNAYYPDSRTARQNLEKWGTQVGTDALSNVLKEFWPDVKRRLSKKNAATP